VSQMIKTIAEVITGLVGLFGVTLIGVLIQDALKDNPTYRKAHQEKVYDWLLGLRKDFPTFILVLSFLLLASAISSAEQQPITAEQGVEAQAKAKSNAQKEYDFDKQFIAPNGHGGYDCTPIVKERTVISDRMIANPDGTTEWFGDKGIDKTLQEREANLIAIRESQRAHREALLAHGKASGDPDIEKSVKDLEDFQNQAEKDFGWEKKDKEQKEAKAKYDAEQAEKEYKERYKTLVSFETTK